MTLSDLVSAGVALLALVVSTIALWQTRRWRPRPHLVIESNTVGKVGLYNGGDEYRAVRFANRGNGDAIDVRCQLLRDDGSVFDEQSLGTFATDDEGEMLVGASTPIPSEWVKGSAQFMPERPYVAGEVELRVLWRQGPRIERPRSLRIPAARRDR